MSNKEAIRVFQFLARTLPKKFRERFAEEMAEVFAKQLSKNQYSFRQQAFIHKSLLNVAWLSLKQNLNVPIGLSLVLGGCFIVALTYIGTVGFGNGFYSRQEIISAWIMGFCGTLMIINGLAVLVTAPWARKAWVSMVGGAVISGLMYIDFFVNGIRDSRQFHFSIPSTEYLTATIVVALPLLFTIIVSRYLGWREKVLT